MHNIFRLSNLNEPYFNIIISEKIPCLYEVNLLQMIVFFLQMRPRGQRYLRSMWGQIWTIHWLFEPAPRTIKIHHIANCPQISLVSKWYLNEYEVIRDHIGLNKVLFIYKTHFWNHALKTRFLFSKKHVFLQTTLLETTLENTLLLNKKRGFKAWFQKCVL